MRKLITGAAAAAISMLGAVLLAPSAWALLPPEPGSGTAVPVAPSTGGVQLWQVVAIALVAVIIGAVGASLASRTRRGSGGIAPIHA